MGCGNCFSKCFLIVFNIVFLAFGGSCLGLGIYVLVDNDEILALARSVDTSSVDVPSLLEKAAYALIATGSFISIIAFLGCCGAICRSKCMLTLYAVIVGLIFIVEVTAIILAIVYKSDFDKYAKDNLKSLLQTRYKGPYDTSDFLSVAFDLAQILLNCCGIESGAEFNTTSLWNTTYAYDSGGGVYVTGIAVISLTCCKFSNPDAFPHDITNFILSMTDNQCPITKSDSYYSTGCYTALEEKFMSYLNILIGIAVGIGCLEMLGIISACCLMKNNKEEEEDGKKV